MTAWHPDEDYETAQEALGGQSHHELTPGEKAALARAGMASDLEVARQVARQVAVDAIRIDYGLSGTADVNHPVDTEGRERAHRAAAAAAVASMMDDEGFSPVESTARLVARRDRRSRRY